MSHVIETEPSGGFFDYDLPQPEQIAIEDIARALSMTCRFGGHVQRFMSVAEHAVLVYRLVRDAGHPADVCYASLHHDSHEAYLGDVPTPLKRTFGPAWKKMQDNIDEAISEALDVDLKAWRNHPAVKAADAQALQIEAAVLKSSRGVGEHWGNDRPAYVPPWAMACWPPREAEEIFLHYHRCARAGFGAHA